MSPTSTGVGRRRPERARCNLSASAGCMISSPIADSRWLQQLLSVCSAVMGAYSWRAPGSDAAARKGCRATYSAWANRCASYAWVSASSVTLPAVHLTPESQPAARHRGGIQRQRQGPRGQRPPGAYTGTRAAGRQPGRPAVASSTRHIRHARRSSSGRAPVAREKPAWLHGQGYRCLVHCFKGPEASLGPYGGRVGLRKLVRLCLPEVSACPVQPIRAGV